MLMAMDVKQSRQALPCTDSSDELTRLSKLPRHVAVIMDGNGRWAEQRQLPRVAGHRAGLESVRSIVKACSVQGIEVLTLFAFSSENWLRPSQEVSFLMDLFHSALTREAKKLHKNNVQLRIIGDCSRFSSELRACITQAEQLTANNTGLKLIIAANYGGKWDITQAVQHLLQKILQGKLSIEAINADVLHDHMSLSGLPEPDLFIRTSGERRISNFLIWDLAYTELYFTDTLWPDFNETAFATALSSYADRERRFGLTGAQITGEDACA
jgi:undecaprenyl diphosphate synthase